MFFDMRRVEKESHAGWKTFPEAAGPSQEGQLKEGPLSLLSGWAWLSHCPVSVVWCRGPVGQIRAVCALVSGPCGIHVCTAASRETHHQCMPASCLGEQTRHLNACLDCCTAHGEHPASPACSSLPWCAPGCVRTHTHTGRGWNTIPRIQFFPQAYHHRAIHCLHHLLAFHVRACYDLKGKKIHSTGKYSGVHETKEKQLFTNGKIPGVKFWKSGHWVLVLHCSNVM